MLRSMFIGLAIAALLQIGAKTFSPAGEVALASNRIDWVELQAAALTRLVCQGYTLISQ